MKIMPDGSVRTDDGKLQLSPPGSTDGSLLRAAVNQGMDLTNNGDGAISAYDNRLDDIGDLPEILDGIKGGKSFNGRSAGQWFGALNKKGWL